MNKQEFEQELPFLKKENAQLKRALERLQQEHKALANANVHAAELMVALEEANKEKDLAVQAAKRAMKAKDAFLRNMSHEIRTPMNGILGMSSLLMYTNLEPQQVQWLKTIQKSGDILLSIINRILDMSKIESGTVDVKPQNASLMSFLEDLMKMSETQLKEKGLYGELLLDEGLPDFIIFDPEITRQILINLIGNAIKFTVDGSVTLSCHQQQSTNKEYIVFKVSDTGVGIENQHLEKIFNSFYRIKNSRCGYTEGTGLGLAISKSLAKLIGGYIEVKSVPEKGSEFSLIMPLNRPVAPVGSGTQSKQPQLPQFPDTRMLVVDDNQTNLLVIKCMLKLFGLNVDEACNGQEAVEKCNQQNFDIVLMDCEMPILDGYEATTQIRTIPDFTRTPIIAFSAHAMHGAKEKCLSYGMNDFLSKPVKLNELETILLSYINN